MSTYRLIDSEFGRLVDTYAAGVARGTFDQDLTRPERAEVAGVLRGIAAMLKGWDQPLTRAQLDSIANILTRESAGTVMVRVSDILHSI